MRAIRSTLLLTTLVLISLAATCTLQAQPPTLESRVQRLVADHKGKAAVAIKDLTTGETLALQGDEPMPTASLIKVAVMVEAYRQLSGTAEDGFSGIKGKQTKAKSCVVNGTGGSLSTTGTLVLVAD